jgi:hypothetical protein
MARQTKCYVLRICDYYTQQIVSVYTSAKAADRNKTIYQRSHGQFLEQNGKFLEVLECPFNKVFE